MRGTATLRIVDVHRAIDFEILRALHQHGNVDRRVAILSERLVEWHVVGTNDELCSRTQLRRTLDRAHDLIAHEIGRRGIAGDRQRDVGRNAARVIGDADGDVAVQSAAVGDRHDRRAGLFSEDDHRLAGLVDRDLRDRLIGGRRRSLPDNRTHRQPYRRSDRDLRVVGGHDNWGRGSAVSRRLGRLRCRRRRHGGRRGRDDAGRRGHRLGCGRRGLGDRAGTGECHQCQRRQHGRSASGSTTNDHGTQRSRAGKKPLLEGCVRKATLCGVEGSVTDSLSMLPCLVKVPAGTTRLCFGAVHGGRQQRLVADVRKQYGD